MQFSKFENFVNAAVIQYCLSISSVVFAHFWHPIGPCFRVFLNFVREQDTFSLGSQSRALSRIRDHFNKRCAVWTILRFVLKLHIFKFTICGGLLGCQGLVWASRMAATACICMAERWEIRQWHWWHTGATLTWPSQNGGGSAPTHPLPVGLRPPDRWGIVLLINHGLINNG